MDYFHSLNTDVGVYCNSVYEIFPADNYMFKVTNRNTRTGCEICSKLPIKTPEQRQWLVINFFMSSDITLMSLLLILQVDHTSSVSVVDFIKLCACI